MKPPGIRPPEATHIATNKKHGHMFYCFEKDGSYWLIKGEGDTRDYHNYSSLWKEGFDFEPLEELTNDHTTIV